MKCEHYTQDREADPEVECFACTSEELRQTKLQKDELLKVADALLGKMGGRNSPVQPVYEDEFLALELLVDRLNGNDLDSIEKRKCSPHIHANPSASCRFSAEGHCMEPRS